MERMNLGGSEKKSTFTPAWVSVEKGSLTEVWEVRIFGSHLLGSFSVQATWLPDTGVGSYTLFKDLAVVRSCESDGERYESREAFLNAVWDDVTRELGEAVTVVNTAIQQVSQMYPTLLAEQ